MPEPLHRSAAPADDEEALRFIGEELGALLRSFDEHGLIGVIAIDTRPLATIETQFGGEAHRRCIDELGRVIHACIGSRLREELRTGVVVASCLHPAPEMFFYI